MEGLFYLRVPKDLLAKLRHDYARFDADPVDAYAAFDFFITARHLPEWLYPDDPAKKNAAFDNELMKVCRHIADGSKHFRLTDGRHESVRHTLLEGAWVAPGWMDPQLADPGRLVVELEEGAADVLGATIECRELAKRILHFWETHPDMQ